MDNPWKLSIFIFFGKFVFIFIWALSHIRRWLKMILNHPKIQCWSLKLTCWVHLVPDISNEILNIEFPLNFHTFHPFINNLILCCRSHVVSQSYLSKKVSQSQSMLGKFVESLVFSARLWYAVVLKASICCIVIKLSYLDETFWCLTFYLIGWSGFRVLLVISSFGKKFSGMTNEEILGSEHVIH